MIATRVKPTGLSGRVRMGLGTALCVVFLTGLALAQTTSRSQMRTWIRLLHSPDVQTRSSAASSLLGTQDEEAVRAVRNALEPKNPPAIRLTAIKAFEFWSNDEAVDKIIAALDDKDEELRQAAAAALVKIKTLETLSQLQNTAEDKKASVNLRTTVIGILGEKRDLKAVPTLIRLLGDPEETVNKAARASLERITLRSFDTGYEWYEWWEQANKLTYVELLEQQVRLQADQLQKTSILVERLYLRLIEERKDQDDPALLIEALQESGSDKVQLEAIAQLTQVNGKDKAVADQITKALVAALRDEGASVRAKAAESLAARNNAEVVTGLIRVLQDPVPFVRSAAAASLGALKAPAAVEFLCTALNDKSLDVAAAAATALGAIGDPKSLPPLIELTKRHAAKPETPVYEAAGKAVANIPDPKTLDFITSTLVQSSNVNVRYEAVRALGDHAKHSPDQVLACLAAVLQKDKNPQVRSRAVTSLADTGNRKAIPMIVVALSDNKAEVSEHAHRSLTRLADGNADWFDDAIGLLAKEKKFDLAEKILASALEILGRQPNLSAKMAELRNHLAQSLIAAQAWGKARPHLEELYRGNPKNADVIKDVVRCWTALLGKATDPKAYDPLMALLAKAREDVPAENAVWWAETALLAQRMRDAGHLKTVVEFVDSLEKQDKALGGAASSKTLLELREQAKAKLNPPPAPAPAAAKPANAAANAKPAAPEKKPEAAN